VSGVTLNLANLPKERFMAIQRKVEDVDSRTVLLAKYSTPDGLCVGLEVRDRETLELLVDCTFDK
jgi:hypothetical protein